MDTRVSNPAGRWKNKNLCWQRNTKFAHQNYLQGFKKKYICCVAKAVLRGKFIAIKAYVKNEERPEIKNLTFSLKRFQKEEKTKSKTSRRKEK